MTATRFPTRSIAAIAAAGIAVATPVVANWEGLETKVYLDVIGVPTVCYGETQGIQWGRTYTPAECRAMLVKRLPDYAVPLLNCIGRNDIPDKVAGALISWTYNVGVTNACRSTLVRYARAGNWEAACNELPKWNRAGGRVIRGLTNRRADERRICLQGVRV
jgi:GH24 family phage-related lysozyme (muramidase)